ncbi:hypothetical protein DMA11_15935 [Marinilabiliaceae bacterium JC017]|nr:hypothetical protein DMA11_15935 [Marinilabiliaceae bacterium JC017]
MNQIFSFSRFVKLATYYFSIQKRRFLLIIGGAFVALFLFLLGVLVRKNNWDGIDWAAMFYLIGFMGATLYIGTAFSYLRKKETTVNMLMVPASVFEKYLLEFFNRIVMFVLLYPVLFILTRRFAVAVANFLKEGPAMAVSSLSELFKMPSDDMVLPFIFVVILGVLVVFAGTAAIRKYPLIKTLIFVGVVFIACVGYFYLILEKMNLAQGIAYVFESIFHDQDTFFASLYVIIGSSSLLSLVYGFFKLKEKEV